MDLPAEQRERLAFPLYKIAALERVVGPAIAVLLCPIEGEFGRTAMIFTARGLARNALEAMPPLPYTCEIEEIATLAAYREMLAGLKAAGDTHIVIDAIPTPGATVEAKCIDIARFDKICAF
jgi:hypothetical protein